MVLSFQNDVYSIGPRLCACASSYQNRLDFGGFNTHVRLPSHLVGTPNVCRPVLASFTRYSGQARALYMDSRPTEVTEESGFEVYVVMELLKQLL